MAAKSTLKISAIIVVVLSLLIISFPDADGANVPSSSYNIQGMRLIISWGDVNNTVSASDPASTWDGALTLSGGQIKVLNQLRFQDPNDRILNKDGEQIKFQSDINSDYDGLQIRLIPDQSESNPTLFFDSKKDGRFAFPLKTLARDKTQTVAVGSGYTIVAEVADVAYDMGSLQDQLHALIAERQVLCSASGSRMNECIAQLTKDLTFKTLQQKLSALSQERSNADLGLLVKNIHPDYLNLLGKKALSDLTREDLHKFDFTELTHLSPTLYRKLLDTAPELIKTLSVELQDRVLILEGSLPAGLAKQVMLDSTTYGNFRQIIQAMPDIQRVQLFKRLGVISPSNWQSLKSLSLSNLTLALHFIAEVPLDKSDAALTKYLDQLKKLETLDKNFKQIETLISTGQANTVKEIFSQLRAVMIDDSTLTPSIYKELEDFFSRVSILTKEDRDIQLTTLMIHTKKVLSESTKAKVSKGILAFSDANENAWFHTYVAEASRLGIIGGYKDKSGKNLNLFGPADNVTIAELLKMTLETSGAGSTQTEPTHSEAKNHWAKGYVAQGEKLKLSILANAKIDLNRAATRAEVVRTIFEAFGFYPKDPVEFAFSDVTKDTIAARHIYYAYELGIVSGDDGSKKFRPNDSINRAEVAKIIATTIALFKQPLDNTSIGGDLNL
ncbi:MAG: S-layer homology domain-containing protein [Candidatus Gracilibacteria bacterium]